MNRRIPKEGLSLGKAKCWTATPAAIRVSVETHPGAFANQRIWIPISQVHDDSEVYGMGDVGNIVVTHWWASRNGFA